MAPSSLLLVDMTLSDARDFSVYLCPTDRAVPPRPDAATLRVVKVQIADIQHYSQLVTTMDNQMTLHFDTPFSHRHCRGRHRHGR